MFYNIWITFPASLLRKVYMGYVPHEAFLKSISLLVLRKLIFLKHERMAFNDPLDAPRRQAPWF